jgi:hypothetical protein
MKYWVTVRLHGELLFQIRDDGTVEYGDGYTPEKAIELFDAHWPQASEVQDCYAVYVEAKDGSMVNETDGSGTATEG